VGTGSVSPREATVAEIINNGEDWESTLVLIKKAAISGGNVFKDYDVVVVDASGSIDMYTSQYASFADTGLPSGDVDITAVVGQFNDNYQVYIRNLSDIDGGTIEPPTGIFTDDFETDLSKWNAVSVIGDQVWEQVSQYGNPGGCAKMTGYDGTSYENEDWMITPELDFTSSTGVKLTFDNATNYDGDPMELYISTDYSGTGDPNGANWTLIEYTKSDGSWNWTSSTIDLSTYDGQKLYIAFKFTSGSDKSATWEVDNVVIK
jgi:hypothetical protein